MQNVTELKMNEYIVLISYKTPVALFDRTLKKYFKTSKYWSKTTSKHINQFIGNNSAEEINQESFDKLLEVK